MFVRNDNSLYKHRLDLSNFRFVCCLVRLYVNFIGEIFEIIDMNNMDYHFLAIIVIYTNCR
jgi:hypothetical protein